MTGVGRKAPGGKMRVMDEIIKRYNVRKRLAIGMSLVMVLGLLSNSLMQVRAEKKEVIITVTEDDGGPVEGASVIYTITRGSAGSVSGDGAGTVSGGSVSDGNGNMPFPEITGSGTTDAQGKITIGVSAFTEGMTISLEISKEEFGKRIVPEQALEANVAVSLRKIPEIRVLEGVYNRADQELVTVISRDSDGDEIRYSTDGVNWQEEVPTGKEAGEYAVYVQVSREGYERFETGKLTAIIEKAKFDVELSPYKADYDQEEHPALSFSGLETGDKVICRLEGANRDICFDYDGADSVKVPAFRTPGEYVINVKVERENYETYEEQITAVINSVDIPGLTAAMRSDLVYNGQDQELLEAIEGLEDGDRVSFAVKPSADASQSVEWKVLTDQERPRACDTGTYQVGIKVEREYYNETEIIPIPEVCIQKAEPQLVFVDWPQGDRVDYDSQGDNIYHFSVSCNALQPQEISYSVENVVEDDETDIAEIASVVENGENAGNLIITQAGHIIRVTATTAETSNYTSVSATRDLVIRDTDEDLIRFGESQVNFTLGTDNEISVQRAEKRHEDDNGAVTYEGEVTGFAGELKDVGIELSDSGEVLLEDLGLLSDALGKKGSLNIVITASKREGTREYQGGIWGVYAECQARYTILLSTEEIPERAYTKYNSAGEEILPGNLVNGWHNTAVTVRPAEGYSIARDRVINAFGHSVVFGGGEGNRKDDQGVKSRIIYLKNEKTGGITAPITIDLEKLDNEKPYDLQIHFPEPEQTKDGIKYYDGEITIIFTAKDDTSGVEKFHWSYKSDGGAGSTLKNAEGDLEAVQDKEDPTRYTAYLTLPEKEAEQLRGHLEVYAQDAAGNLSDVLPADGIFVVDTIAPEQNVSFGLRDGDGTWQTVGTKHYFSGSVDFVFHISEANFFGEDVHISLSKDGGAAREQSVTWKSVGEGEYEAMLTLEEDGNYVIGMNYTDRSGHEMPSYTSGTIVVDTTAPVIEFAYEDHSGENPQRAVITVTEHNFRQSDIVVTTKAEDIAGQEVLIEDLQNYLRNCRWEHEGDVHRAYLSDVFADAIYVLTCNYQDLALNPAEVRTNPFVVDHTPPSADKMSVSYSASVKDTVLSVITLGFYNPAVTVTFTAYDDTAGVDYFTWSYKRQEGVSAENLEQYGDTQIAAVQDFADRAKFTASITLPGEQARQLRGSIAFTATDKYGNESKKLTDSGYVLVVDTVSPVITAEYSPPDNSFGGKLYYNKALTATFTVAESNFFSEDVIVMLAKDEEEPIRVEPVWTDLSADVHEGTYVIEAPDSHANDGDYVFTVSYTDRSGNAMEEYTSDIFVIDTILPVIEVQYDNGSPVNTLADGQGMTRKYFPAQLSATLTITEHNFNPEDIEYSIAAADVAGNPLDADALYRVTGWSSDGDVNTATIVFPGDANYTFDIAYTDLALHEMADYPTEYFTVDTSMPETPEVTYSASVLDIILANISFGFYNAQMTVNVTAVDRISGVHGFVYSYLKADGVSTVNAELAEQPIEEAQISFSEGGAAATASFQISQAALAAGNQFNGTVRVRATDRAGNQTDDLQDGKRIVVDNIAPTATVEYNMPVQEVDNISYYDGDINATVTIQEANFYSEDVTISVTRDGAPYTVTPVWNDNGTDVHTGNFTLTQDGDYFVEINYADKSGNTMQQYLSEQMTIDTQIEEAVITVNGMEGDGKAFKDEVVLEVSFEDTNFEDYEILLTRTNFANKNMDVTEQFVGGRVTTNALGGSGRFDTFLKTPENDGIYTVKVSLSDRAGHTVEKTVTFTVNRYGSVYEYSDYLVNLIKDGGAYIQRMEEDLLITEYNADRLVSQSIDIEISRDGKPLENCDYTVIPQSNETAEAENKNWYQYQYIIPKENFSSDGVYKISVSSTDQTGNTPENTNYEDKTILFRVDSTAPEINSITGLESAIVNATSLEIKYTIYDTIGLESVAVYLDGKEKENITDFAEDAQNYYGSLLLTENPQARRVRLVVKDLAGNVTDTDAENFISAFAFTPFVTISTNAVVRWYADKALFWGSIGGAAAVVGSAAGSAILFRRRRIRTARA